MKKLIITITLLLNSNALFAYDVNESIWQQEDMYQKDRQNRLLEKNNETLRHIEQMMQRQENEDMLILKRQP